MSDFWEFAIHRNGDASLDRIGVVLFNGDDIIGFVSNYDFRDTNMDGTVSFGEKYFGSIGFNRAIFVSTAIKELTGAITDPAARSFDYDQIQQLRYATMMHAVTDVASEVLQDAAVDALIGAFGGPIISRMAPDGGAQFLLTTAGNALMPILTTELTSSVSPDVSYGDYEVRYIGNSSADDVGENTGGTTSQIVYSNSSTRAVSSAGGNDIIIIGEQGTSTVDGGDGYDKVVYDRFDYSVGQTINTFATLEDGRVRLFDGTALVGIESLTMSFGNAGDTVNLAGYPISSDLELMLGGGDDHITMPVGNAIVHGGDGGDGEDTLVVDFRNSSYGIIASQISRENTQPEGSHSYSWSAYTFQDWNNEYQYIHQSQALGFENFIAYGSVAKRPIRHTHNNS